MHTFAGGIFQHMSRMLILQSRPVTGHELLVDVSRGQLFCAACDDYVYSTEFDAAIAVGGVSAHADEYRNDDGLCSRAMGVPP